MGASPSREAGTASNWKSTISSARSRVCATRGRTSAATSLAAGGESRSCWKTRLATPSNSSNPQETDVVVSGQLEDKGLGRIEQSARRKVAYLTDEGRAHVQEHRDELVSPWETATEDYGEELIEPRGLV